MGRARDGSPRALPVAVVCALCPLHLGLAENPGSCCGPRAPTPQTLTFILANAVAHKPKGPFAPGPPSPACPVWQGPGPQSYPRTAFAMAQRLNGYNTAMVPW